MNKLITVTILALVVAVPHLPAQTLIGPETRNGSFESGSAHPWQGHGVHSEVIKREVRESTGDLPAADGKKYFALAAMGHDVNRVAVRADQLIEVPVEPGQVITVEAKVRTRSLDEFTAANIGLVFWAGEGSRPLKVQTSKVVKLSDTEWTALEHEFVYEGTSAADRLDLRIGLFRQGPLGTLIEAEGYVDAVTVTLGADTKQN